MQIVNAASLRSSGALLGLAIALGGCSAQLEGIACEVNNPSKGCPTGYFCQSGKCVKGNTAPFVDWGNSPVEATPIAGQQKFRPQVSDLDGVAKVELLVDGASVGQAVTPIGATGAPVEVALTIDTGSFADGAHEVVVRATDSLGASTDIKRTYSFDNTKPTTPEVLISPNPAKRGTTLTIQFTASETLANVAVSVGERAAFQSAKNGNAYTFTYAVDSSDAEGVHIVTVNLQDPAGNSGGRAASATFDFTPPQIPNWTGSSPSSPSNSPINPVLVGTAEPRATVTVFTDDLCTSATGSATAADSSAFKITVPLIANAATRYWVNATDPAGNTSQCSGVLAESGSIVFVSDQLESVPSLLTTSPASPSNTTFNPAVAGIADTGPSTSVVSIFTNAGCTGSPVASGSAVSFIAAGISVPLAVNSSTTYWARSSDAAGNISDCSSTRASNGSITFVSDRSEPTPSFLGTLPVSPSNTTSNPLLKGTAETTLSPSTVSIFTNASCTGSPVASGPAASFVGAGIPVPLVVNSSTTYWARSSDAVGNTSACSSTLTSNGSITFASDRIENTPSVTATNPVSPSNTTSSPLIIGTAPAGGPSVSTVFVFANANCSGTAVNTGTPAQFASPGIAVSLNLNQTTTYTALSKDTAGNVSACSSTLATNGSITFTSDTVPPDTTITSQPFLATNKGSASFTYSCTGGPCTFQCSLNGAAFSSCANGGQTYDAVLGGANTFRVRAIDAAQNVDPTPASYTWTYTNGAILQYAMEGDARQTGVIPNSPVDYTATAAGVTFVPGNYGLAAQMANNASSSLVLPISSLLNADSTWTISFWFREAAVSNKPSLPRLFENNGSPNRLETYHGSQATSLTTCVTSIDCKTFSYSIANWHNLVYAYGGAGQPVEMYLDGNFLFTIAGPPGNLFAQSNNLVFGLDTNFAIDDVRIYNVPYTANVQCTEILGLFWNGETCVPAIPILRYDFEQSAKNTGSLGAAFDGVVTGPVTYEGGRIGSYSAKFWNADTFITLPSTGRSPAGAPGPLATSFAYTIAYWIREDSMSPPGTAFWDNRQSGTPPFGGVSISSASGHHDTQVWGTTGSTGGGFDPLAAQYGPWHHVLVRYQGTSTAANGGGPMTYYHDGKFLFPMTSSTDNPFTTGQAPSAALGHGTFAYLDDVRVYNQVFSDQQNCQMIAGGNYLFADGSCALVNEPAPSCVDPTGADTNSGTCTSPFKTITKALSVATQYQTVRVRPGTYSTATGETFPINVPDDVSLIGDEINKGVVTVPTAINGCSNITGLPEQTAVLVGTRASVAGFSASCTGGAGISVFGKTAAIVRNNTTNGMNHGIWMVNSVDNFLVGNISNSNKFDGIVADNNSGARIENNTLSRNAGEALVIQTNAAVDLGGGSMGSLGGNILSCSGTTDLWVNTAGTIQAQNNKWDHVPPTTSSNVPPSTCNAGSDICLNLTGISVVTNGATQAIGFCQ